MDRESNIMYYNRDSDIPSSLPQSIDYKQVICLAHSQWDRIIKELEQ